MTTTTRTRKPATPELRTGDAVRFADGGEALVIGVDDGHALLRVGTLHDDPLRVPMGLVSKVASGNETDRRGRFRREAQHRGEL